MVSRSGSRPPKHCRLSSGGTKWLWPVESGPGGIRGSRWLKATVVATLLAAEGRNTGGCNSAAAGGLLRPPLRLFLGTEPTAGAPEEEEEGRKPGLCRSGWGNPRLHALSTAEGWFSEHLILDQLRPAGREACGCPAAT
mmetsp:Transcript_18935/g.52811  ORF Transcript_18935/g.52811 Transcript_18935/m.52811 type:complete len:139 (+) Transcript_18935:323-739(+)